jgi:putative ABC transport system permease protein
VRIRRIIVLAWKGIWLHRLRSLLTVLGIVFGVSSVVAMLAIGEGASAEAQNRIRRLGSRNLILTSRPPPASESASEERQRTLEYGLLYADRDRIRTTIPEIRSIASRRNASEELRQGARKMNGELAGISPNYADIAQLRLLAGRFLTPIDELLASPVCVLGDTVAQRLFLNSNPIGRFIRAGAHPYRVVGVLEPRGEPRGGAGTGVDDVAFVPLGSMQQTHGDILAGMTSGNLSLERVELHAILVQAQNSDLAVKRIAKALRKLVERWHPKEDVRLTVPLELLKEAEEAQRIWTIVLGSIAAISLLVGGIGIMNIMLASVMERTREVGIRRALGARRRHIIVHFLAETVVLSVSGGLIGLLLGVLLPRAVSHLFDMDTVVTAWSLGLAFGISAAVGIIFGLYPAIRAADLDPVEALRRD